MADQVALLQEAANRGILPDNLKPLYQEAVSRGLIKPAMNNGQGPGYIASDTGQFTPIQNAGQVAPSPTGNAALGALKGAYNALMGAGSGMAAGAYATLKPHSSMAQASDNFDQASKFLQGNQLGPSGDLNTDAAQQAVQGAAQTLAGAPQAFYDTGVNKITSLANKLPWANAANTFINKHPSLMAFENATQTGGDVAANTVLPAVAGKISGMAKQGLADSVMPTPDTALAKANALNLVVKPSSAKFSGGSAPIGKLLEGIGGSAKVGVDAAVKNQPTLTSLAAADIPTLKPGVSPTETALDNAAKPYFPVYDEMRGLSKTHGKIPTDSDFVKAVKDVVPEDASDFGENPKITALQQKYLAPDEFSSASILREVQSLRKNATSNYTAARKFQVENAPELKNLADAQQGIADALEDRLDRFASQFPDNQDLVSRYRTARVELAKINTLKNAIPQGTEDVSAPFLAKQLNAKKPLSGNMLQIAKLANAFPDETRFAPSLKNKVPINVLDSAVGLGGAVTSAATGRFGPGAAALDWMVGRPLLRQGLLSTPYQNSMLPKAPMDPMLMRLLMGGAPAALNSQGNQK